MELDSTANLILIKIKSTMMIITNSLNKDSQVILYLFNAEPLQNFNIIVKAMS